MYKYNQPQRIVYQPKVLASYLSPRCIFRERRYVLSAEYTIHTWILIIRELVVYQQYSILPAPTAQQSVRSRTLSGNLSPHVSIWSGLWGVASCKALPPVTSQIDSHSSVGLLYSCIYSQVIRKWTKNNNNSNNHSSITRQDYVSEKQW